MRLDETVTIKPFECEKGDLNDFLRDDALNYAKELLAVTHLYEYEGKTVAFYSVFNDRIVYDDFSGRSARDKFLKCISFQKRRSSLPSVTIGRLGVHKDYEGIGIGTAILDYVKMSFTTLNKTGCRFITVDAYTKPLRTTKFYQRNGFVFLTSKDEGKETRLRYFDLMEFVGARNAT